MQLRFRTKLVFFFLALIIIGQIITHIAVYVSTRPILIDQIFQSLHYSYAQFEQQLQIRAQNLVSEARTLSNEETFRNAVLNGNEQISRNAIQELEQHIDADRIMLVDHDYTIIADSNAELASRQPFIYPDIIDKAKGSLAYTAFVASNRYLTEIIVVPVLAPEPIAWMVISFTLNDFSRHQPGTLTAESQKISFIAYDETSARIVLSDLPENVISNLDPMTMDEIIRTADNPALVPMDNESYVTLSHKLVSPEKTPAIYSVLQTSLTDAMQPYMPLMYTLILLAIGGIFVVSAGGMLIARTVTRPIDQLSDAAHRIEAGDYSHKTPVIQDDEFGKLASAFNHMMTTIAEREESISNQAHIDALTQFPNRLAFEERMEATINYADKNNSCFTVILIGIDRYAEISNMLGHHLMDKLVRQIGDRLRTVVKQTDTMARLSSDEFILLLPDSTIEQSEGITERLADIFEEHFNIENINVDISAHLGIAAYPVHGNDTKTLMQRADIAKYLGIKFSQRSFVYDEERDPFLQYHLSLMGELKKGLDRDELEFYFQPKIDLQTNEVVQVEALIRWQHPKYGLMQPDEFIPLAEQTGQINKLTAWSMEKAIRQRSAWQLIGINIGIAINLSAKDLMNPRLIKLVSALLDHYEISANEITLEITESAVMQDPSHALLMLQELHRMGLNLSIDDFGTGYSSMTYLKQLPVNELKIDKSFVTFMTENPEDEIIVKSTIDLAHNLGLKVTAEGVENSETLKLLTEQGCDIAQGHIFADAMPLQALKKWLQDRNISPEKVEKIGENQ